MGCFISALFRPSSRIMMVQNLLNQEELQMHSKAYEEAKREFYNCLRMVPFTLGFSLYFAFREWRPIMKKELQKERTHAAA